MTALSIVIVNYNTREMTLRCLDSLYSNTRDLEFEVILVDNGSQEKISRSIEHQYPRLVLVTLELNEGFARGNNAGIRLAKAPVILLLNSDTIIFDDAIKKTYDFLVSRADIGMVGCKLLNEDGSEQLSSYIPVRYPLFNLFVSTNLLVNSFLRLVPLLKRKYINHLDEVRELQKESHFCEAVSGAFMMFKDRDIHPWGYLDPDFFLYSEETEWCRNRILRHTKIFYYAEASIIHLGGRSAPGELMQKQMLLSSFLYNYKVGLGVYWTCVVIYLTGSFTNLPLLPFMKKENARTTWRAIQSFFRILPDLLFEIPKYANTFGSRPHPLKIKELRELTV